MQLPVTSLEQLTNDPLLRCFSGLRDRDVRADGDLFVAEGEVVVRVLLASPRRRTRAVLFSQPMADKLSSLIPSGVKCYVAPEPLMQSIIGFPMHRGVLALADRGAGLSATDVLPVTGPSFVVGLCGLTNHDNVGGVFRNAAAFGATAVLLDHATCDPLYRKAVRVSVGGTMVVPYAQLGDERSVIDALVQSGHEVLALSPRGELVIGVDPPPPTGRIALLLGAEGPGLSDAVMKRCRTARVPMRGGWDSLNVAVTSGIALAWLFASIRLPATTTA
ncbi:MAG: RNA methyltransferase [Polyangia bacterium]